MADDAPSLPGTWKQRRRVIFTTLAGCALGVAFVLLFPGDAIAAPVRGQVALGLLGLAGMTIGSYVFGATWDDKNARKDGP